MTINYSQPTDLMGRLRLTFDAAQTLYGATTGLTYKAEGHHVVFPYATSGSTYNTASAERPQVGVVSFKGMLGATTTSLKSAWLDNLGDIQTSVILKVEAQNTITQSYETLLNKTLYDFRVAGTDFIPQLFGGVTIITGNFQCTFRKAVNV